LTPFKKQLAKVALEPDAICTGWSNLHPVAKRMAPAAKDTAPRTRTPVKETELLAPKERDLSVDPGVPSSVV
jgi:hypothetical protein